MFREGEAEAAEARQGENFRRSGQRLELPIPIPVFRFWVRLVERFNFVRID